MDIVLDFPENVMKFLVLLSLKVKFTVFKSILKQYSCTRVYVVFICLFDNSFLRHNQ